ncbi:hypothetical protein MLD38_015250 [Melastoma candidum]|uniref:Uncharacterized protein n=1 Tax=Melastoma candidum TaxID=119954 RepID=A0ACB9RJ77_9MYRT|nr:hypothetical protein MLD38_015250 [Melastoma candidum]
MACTHDHSCEEQHCSSSWSLYKHVDLPMYRRSMKPFLEVFVMFSRLGNAASILPIWDQSIKDGSVYKSDGIDFSDAQSIQAVQEWDFVENTQGILEYQTKYSRFQSVASITLHFPDNFGGEPTQIHYIGYKGEATQDSSRNRWGLLPSRVRKKA